MAVSDNPYEVEVRVTEAIALFETAVGWGGRRPPQPPPSGLEQVSGALMNTDLEISPEKSLSELILGLPLLKYADGKYIPIRSTKEGTSIRERLEIVKKGDEHPDYTSCIRLTSNILAVTAYRIMEVLGLPPKFDIRSLRSIS